MKLKIIAFSIWDFVFILVFISALAFCFYILFFGSKNNQALMLIAKKDYESADSRLKECLNQDTLLPFCRINKGFNDFLLKKYESSLKEYQTAQSLISDKAEDHPLLFDMAFNSALGETALNNADKALEFYQQALGFKPNSLEVKTNIELLFRKSSEKDKQKKQDSPKGKDEQKKQDGPAGQDKQKGQTGKPSSKISEDQMSAVLKAILEQEKKIRERKNQSRPRSSRVEKDW